MSAGFSLKMFFFGKICFSSSKKVFPYRYVPVETACSNHLKKDPSKQLSDTGNFVVRTGISAIAFACLFRKERAFRGFFWWISLDCHRFCGGRSHADFSPVAIFLLLPLPAANFSIGKSSYPYYKLFSTFLLGFA